ncbi:DUF3117 domain-containing protein [Leucobacter ruminantium]|uniref:DUF3117 domain-containing protein n=1 Tax=Leucobacter ruminantium TaxID=1289170 RepID=A0A939LYE7_9MICO|nr:DUF3117 domain-containing protein [Leucobacter ruminantium]MBO1803760.1 DUF3117 domain-containing protein [Leucobacter ruminantium]
MAAMKPRTGDGPMEAVRESRAIVVYVPVEGGGRIVISVTDQEAAELRDVLAGVLDG